MSLAGDLDLVVGNWDGLLIYAENTGTSTAPVFVQRTGSANPFDGIDFGYLSAPALGDLDNDGTLMRRFSRGRNLFSDTKVPQATDDADAAPEEIVVTPHGHESDQYTEPEEEISTPK